LAVAREIVKVELGAISPLRYGNAVGDFQGYAGIGNEDPPTDRPPDAKRRGGAKAAQFAGNPLERHPNVVHPACAR
jgi:hypothetical protein